MLCEGDSCYDFKLGNIDVDKVYIGTNIVWERYKGLPREYQQVEYLRSTGIQYMSLIHNMYMKWMPI